MEINGPRALLLRTANINAIKYLPLTPARCSLHLSGGGLWGGFTCKGSGQPGQRQSECKLNPKCSLNISCPLPVPAAHLLGSTHALARISLLGNIRPASNNSFALSHPSDHTSAHSAPTTSTSTPPGASPSGKSSKHSL